MARLRLGRRLDARADLNEATVALSLGDQRSGWWNAALDEVALEELRQKIEARAGPPNGR